MRSKLTRLAWIATVLACLWGMGELPTGSLAPSRSLADGFFDDDHKDPCYKRPADYHSHGSKCHGHCKSYGVGTQDPSTATNHGLPAHGRTNCGGSSGNRGGDGGSKATPTPRPTATPTPTPTPTPAVGRNAKCLRSAAGVPFVPVDIEAWSSWAARWSDPGNHGATINPRPGAGDTLLLTAHPEGDGKRAIYWCPSAGNSDTDCLRSDGQVRLRPVLPWLGDQEWRWNYDLYGASSLTYSVLASTFRIHAGDGVCRTLPTPTDTE